MWAYSPSSGLRQRLVFADSEGVKMQSRPFRVLCTEDDLDTRDLITFVLKNNNFEVITTETPELAIELARDFSFDLYLVDNWMPRMSGPDLCREFRRFDNQTPILFYSGAGYGNDKTAAYASGAQGYLVKPVDNDKLVAEVRRLILESQTVRTRHATQANVNETVAPLLRYAAASKATKLSDCLSSNEKVVPSLSRFAGARAT